MNKGYCMRKVLNYVFSLIFMIVSLGNNYWCTKVSAMDKDEDPKKMSQEDSKKGKDGEEKKETEAKEEEEKKEEAGDEETGEESKAEEEEEEEDNANIHECAIADFIESGQLKQGNTNWCLNTCLNLVYRDYLEISERENPEEEEKQRNEEEEEEENNEESMILTEDPPNELFAELAFILKPATTSLSMKSFKAGTKEEVDEYINKFFGVQGLSGELAMHMFKSHLDGASPQRRYDIWEGIPCIKDDTFTEGSNVMNWINSGVHPAAVQPGLPELIKKKFATSPSIVPDICKAIAGKELKPELVNVSDILAGSKHPWKEISKEIWDKQHPVILNTSKFGSSMGHSILAFRAHRKTETVTTILGAGSAKGEVNVDCDVIYIYDPATGNTTEINILEPFNPIIKINDQHVILQSYIKFDY
ncbi:MAG: hypothetical protein IJC97_00370 [Oscillospiraceae bacterium]|nr:hypothetical protein [Oscillospiraceae bacterium]